MSCVVVVVPYSSNRVVVITVSRPITLCILVVAGVVTVMDVAKLSIWFFSSWAISGTGTQTSESGMVSSCGCESVVG